jgi:uncharacterized membrane protein YsdA (DUF1294 family)
MEISIYKIIFAFFYISWLAFQLYIIDITRGIRSYRNIVEKTIILSILLGVCAFLCGVCMGILM